MSLPSCGPANGYPMNTNPKDNVLAAPVILLAIALGCGLIPAARATPPYSGTIFLDPDIITQADASAFQSIVSTGRGYRSMFDRRVNQWLYLNAFLFQAGYDGGLKIEVQVNPEFANSTAALAEASKYALVIGRLPACLRAKVKTVWIHQGVQPFGGGNNNLLIHTGMADQYSTDGILEETLVHEASHTSLDATHANAAGWLAAQAADAEFISTYARDNPTSEDIAESFLVYLTLRHRSERVSKSLLETLSKTIPSRIDYFDRQDFDMQPVATRSPLAVEKFTYEAAAKSWNLTWVSRYGKTYAVDASVDLTTWQELVTGITSQGVRTSVTQTNTTNQGTRFFRVRETISP